MQAFWRFPPVGRTVLPLAVIVAFLLWAGSGLHAVRSKARNLKSLSSRPRRARW